jgi:serine/threonine protein kinase
VLDMGLARFFHDTKDDLTRRLDSGAVLGTADYIAPEQALNSQVDIRADIYSLGATLYTLLAGRPPFGGSSASQKLLAHQMRTPRRLHNVRPEVPRWLSDVVAKMMAREPDDRYQTAQEVLEALSSPRSDDDPLSPSTTPCPPTRAIPSPATPPPSESGIQRAAAAFSRLRNARLSPLIAAAIVTAAVLAGTGGWWLHAGVSRHKPPAQPAAGEPPTASIPR